MGFKFIDFNVAVWLHWPLATANMLFFKGFCCDVVDRDVIWCRCIFLKMTLNVSAVLWCAAYFVIFFLLKKENFGLGKHFNL